MNGVHVPSCDNLDAHIASAVREAEGTHESLDDFVARVRADWHDEQMIADQGDAAVIDFWRAVERDWMDRMGGAA